MKILKHQFIRNILVQFFGTGIAQLIPLLAMLIISDLFTPEDFAIYTSFIATTTVLLVLVGAKYQYAIVLPKDNAEANNLFLASCLLTICLVIVLLVICMVARLFSLDQLFNIEEILFLIPIYVLFYGLWESFALLSIRQEQFKNNAISKVLQALFFSAIAIAIGYLFYLEEGLIIGKIGGVFISCVFLIFVTDFSIKNISKKKLQLVTKKYIEYPKFGIFPSLLNTFSSQFIVLALGVFYDEKILGYYGFTALILMAPLALIGASYKDVFYQKMTSLINLKEYKQAKKLFFNSILFLSSIGSLMLFVFLFFGVQLFILIFGDTWETSGLYASILVISFVVKLVVSPLSSIFNALNKLKKAALWQTAYFISTTIFFFLFAYYLRFEIMLLLKMYVVHEVVLYGLYFLIQYKLIKNIQHAY